MSRDKKNIKEGGFLHDLVSKTQLPCDLLSGEFRLELRGRRELYICGCKKIIEYNEQSIIVRTKAFDVCIEGCELVCASFHCSGIVIEGYIKGIRLENFE